MCSSISMQYHCMLIYFPLENGNCLEIWLLRNLINQTFGFSFGNVQKCDSQRRRTEMKQTHSFIHSFIHKHTYFHYPVRKWLRSPILTTQLLTLNIRDTSHQQGENEVTVILEKLKSFPITLFGKRVSILWCSFEIQERQEGSSGLKLCTLFQSIALRILVETMLVIGAPHRLCCGTETISPQWLGHSNFFRHGRRSWRKKFAMVDAAHHFFSMARTLDNLLVGIGKDLECQRCRGVQFPIFRSAHSTLQ